MVGGIFETKHDPAGPVGPPMSLVFIGSSEDGFVDAGAAYDLQGISRIRFGRSLTGSRVQFQDETEGVRVGIPHPWVSGEHCQVMLEWSPAPRMQLRDLQSRNGTLVENERVVGETRLHVGEVFEVGRTFWMVRGQPPAEAVPGAPTTSDPLYQSHFDVLREKLPGVARADVPVLVVGEDGTGKRRLALALHEASGRAGPMICVALDSLTGADLDAALAGSRRSSVPSFVDQAERGTLFLTGVEKLSISAQTRLRSALARLVEGRGRRDRDVRLVTASRVDLRTMVDERRFRPDLYARLAGVELVLPPLRCRRDRMGELIRSFATAQPNESVQLSTRAFRFTLFHGWPHNVRELRHALSAAADSAVPGPINLASLQKLVQDAPPPDSLVTQEPA